MEQDQTNKPEWQTPQITEIDIASSTHQGPLPPPDEPQLS